MTPAVPIRDPGQPVAARPGEPSPAGSAPGARAPARWVPAALALAVVAHHLALWAWTARERSVPFLTGLDRWDAEHFSRIVTGGYVEPLHAFLPLYPGLVAAVRAVVGGAPALVGTAVSTACLLAFAAIAGAWAAAGPVRELGLLPRTAWGWAVVFLSPASYALHSHHTEGLFLLLSLGALLSAARGQTLLAVLCCALCEWTRNQGLFVTVAVALVLAGSATSGRARALRLALVGGGGLAALGGLLLFEWVVSGDPLAHWRAQAHWNHATTAWEMIRGLWFGNPWVGKVTFWLLLRDVFAAILLAAAVSQWRTPARRWLGVYGLLSLAVMLPQGDLGQAFRFGAVLFPQLGLAGDWLAARPPAARLLALGLLAWLNHQMAHAYFIGSWAY